MLLKAGLVESSCSFVSICLCTPIYHAELFVQACLHTHQCFTERNTQLSMLRVSLQVMILCAWTALYNTMR